MLSLPERARGAFLAFACSLLLLPAVPAMSLVSLALACGWLLLLLAGSVAPSRARLGAYAGAGVLVVVVWVLAGTAYPTAALAFVLVLIVRAGVGPHVRAREIALALAIAALPCALGALAWALGDARAHDALRGDFALPALSYDLVVGYGEVVATAATAFAALAYLTKAARAPRLALVVIVLGVVMLLRARAIVSLASLPGDSQWSEPPILLNLVKLHAHQPLYGPYSECGSYSYSPALETVQRALLAPFGLDLSLLANRAVGVGWQLATIAILARALLPFFPKRAVVRAGVVLSIAIVVTSSFLASNLHPDHLLMLVFAPALALALHGPRVSPRVREVGLVLVPVLCIAVKLTGAGVGLGLALAFVLPWKRRTAIAIAAAGALSVLTLVVSERLFPGFWRYTFVLQASHPIRWDAWPMVLGEAPARIAIVAVVALVATRWLGPQAAEARSDAGRVLLVTLGFTLPSIVAYLKVGGRVNSLLPLAIGSAVALARLAAAQPLGNVAAALALWVALRAVPSLEPVSSHLRSLVVEHHEQAVALIRGELAEGRRPLLYEGTAPWISSGAMDVPRDRQQVMNELVMGKHPDVEQCFARIENGAYDSIILTDGALSSAEPAGPRLREILATRFVRAPEEPTTREQLAPLRLYRYKK